MHSYLAILKDKRKGKLSTDLLTRHVSYLKSLSERGILKICGPFADNDGAMMIFQSNSLEEVKEILNNDPFISEKYYLTYDIKEFLEANSENNWLIDIPQTTSNLTE